VGVQSTAEQQLIQMLASSLFNFPTITCSVHDRLPFYWCHFRTRKLSCRLRLRLRSTLASGTHAVTVLGVMLSLQSASTATPSSIHQLNPSLTTRLVSSPTSGPLAYRNACNASQKSPDDDSLAWTWMNGHRHGHGRVLLIASLSMCPQNQWAHEIRVKNPFRSSKIISQVYYKGP